MCIEPSHCHKIDIRFERIDTISTGLCLEHSTNCTKTGCPQPTRWGRDNALFQTRLLKFIKHVQPEERQRFDEISCRNFCIASLDESRLPQDSAIKPYLQYETFQQDLRSL